MPRPKLARKTSLRTATGVPKVRGVRGALYSLRGPRARQGTERLAVEASGATIAFCTKNVISCELKFTGGGTHPRPGAPAY